MQNANESDLGSVLVIEDDLETLELLEVIFAEAGLHVYRAADGRTALSLLRQIPRPSFVLLDLVMPLLSGQEFLTRARENGLLSGVHVVVLTASQLSPPAGVSELIQKP